MGSGCGKLRDITPQPQRAKYKLPLVPEKKQTPCYQTFVAVPPRREFVSLDGVNLRLRHT